MTDQPSQRAMKLAGELASKYELAREFGRGAAPHHTDLAAIIDSTFPAYLEIREALRELVEVIKPLVEIDDNVCYLNGRYAAQMDTRLDQAEAALAKARTTTTDEL